MDDVRVSNPPSNPQLLDELAKRFTDYNYDFKNSFGTSVIRELINCRATTESNKDDLRNFARSHLRRLRPKSFWTQFHKSPRPRTNSRVCPSEPRPFRSQTEESAIIPHHLRAVYAETVCSCEVVMEPSLSQALHLLNGEATNTVSNRARSSRNYSRKEKPGSNSGRSVCLLLFPQAESRGKANLLAALVGSESPSNRWKTPFGPFSTQRSSSLTTSI